MRASPYRLQFVCDYIAQEYERGHVRSTLAIFIGASFGPPNPTKCVCNIIILTVVMLRIDLKLVE